MNRVRLAMLAGVFAVGALGLSTSSARAQSMGGNRATAPRYYAPGGGYYYTPQPAPNYYAPAPAYRAPDRSMSRGGNRSAYDVTGRHDRLARPWLKPLR